MQKLLFTMSKGFEKSGGATRAMQFAAQLPLNREMMSKSF